MGKKRIATTWLDGCSGCHMSLLDMDEHLIDIAGQVDIVYGPLVDTKAIPEGIDVVLVEGAVSTDADVEKLRLLRARSAILVSLGDCAVTANVPGMRNRFPLTEVLKRGYEENAPLNAQIPREDRRRAGKMALKFLMGRAAPDQSNPYPILREDGIPQPEKSLFR